jgi:hypothetical protein
MHAYATLQLAHHPSDLGLALDHFLRWIPVGPFLFIMDGRDTRPFEAGPAYAYAIADGTSASLDQKKKVSLWINHDSAGRIGGGIINGFTEIDRIDVRQSNCWNRKGFAAALRINSRIRVWAAQEWP